MGKIKEIAKNSTRILKILSLKNECTLILKVKQIRGKLSENVPPLFQVYETYVERLKKNSKTI